MNENNNMRISLDIKQPSAFFWLCRIRGVDISRCCKKCFIGESESRLYHETRAAQGPIKCELDLTPDKKYLAYYLCGLSNGFVYHLNTHVAFLHAPGETLRIETEQIQLEISNARWIDFEGSGYVPNPEGEFTAEQRACRNWIFANYIKDGMINSAVNLPPGGEEL